MNWHSFRHSFTVALRQQGAHPKAVSALLGHSHVQLHMDVYDRIQEDDMKQMATIVAAFVYNTAMRDQKLPRKAMPGQPNARAGQ